VLCGGWLNRDTPPVDHPVYLGIAPAPHGAAATSALWIGRDRRASLRLAREKSQRIEIIGIDANITEAGGFEIGVKDRLRLLARR